MGGRRSQSEKGYPYKDTSAWVDRLRSAAYLQLSWDTVKVDLKEQNDQEATGKERNISSDLFFKTRRKKEDP